MVKRFTDEKTIKLVEKSVEKNNEKKKKSNFHKKLSRFLIDFNILSYTFAFLIAISFQKFLSNFINFLMSYIFKEEKHKIFSSLITFLLILFFCFLFVQFIFYKFIYTEDIEKENIIKSAIEEKKKEKARKEISEEPIFQKEIEKTGDIDLQEEEMGESFSNFYYVNNNQLY